MIVKYYVDTFVFGGYFDKEFEKTTKELFSQIERDRVTILYSEMTETELMTAPEKIQIFVRSLNPEKY